MAGVELKYIADNHIKGLHPAWKRLKAEHAAAVKTGAVKFDKGLGGMLDKRQTFYKSLKAFGKGSSALIAIGQLKQMKTNATALDKVAKTYVDRVKNLPDPAKEELTEYLQDISRAVQTDTAWATTKLNLLQKSKDKAKK